MTKTSSRKLSRRDAIKLLGAAVGASVLANLPSKWSTPEIAKGVLPAHAQTSAVLATLQCGPDIQSSFTFAFNSTVTIDPPLDGIVMRWNLTFNNSGFIDPSPTTGTAATVGGVATYISPLVFITAPGATITVTWSFENPLDGTGTCDQVFTWNPIIIP
jgi:hypothetical protein